MKLKMNDCLLLILSFLTGWYICNRYHERDRLVEGLSNNGRRLILLGIIIVTGWISMLIGKYDMWYFLVIVLIIGEVGTSILVGDTEFLYDFLFGWW